MEKMRCMETGTREQPSHNVERGILAREGLYPLLVSDAGRTVLPGPFWDGWTRMLARQVAWFPAAGVFPPCPVIVPLEEMAGAKGGVQILFMHRLRGQVVSLFGHIAIIVRGRVWNFSAVLAENEVLAADEFYWRPCLPPFVPQGGTDLPASLHRVHPAGSSWGTVRDREDAPDPAQRLDDERSAQTSGPRADRYGRRFMRSMDVIDISGLEPASIAALEKALTQLMDRVREAAPRSRRGESPYFSPWKMNCAGFVREAFALAGLAHFHSHLPRDLFVEIGWHFTRQARLPESSVRIERRRMAQVAVSGIRPSSSAVPLLNPASWWRVLRMG